MSGERATWAGHPPGLSTLFFTEMWERFSYYGMRAILILYMTAPLAAGGLAFETPRAASTYGWYTFGVYAASIPGGWIADRFLGHYRSVLAGGIIIALGHFSLAFRPLPFFMAGLFLIVLGTGLLKPNISTMVGALYDEKDARRDAGFSIFYMGINLGATVAPLIVGTLGQRVDWHAGFAVAGIGMTLGVVQYVLGRKRLRPAIERLAPERERRPAAPARLGPEAGTAAAARLRFTAVEWKRIAAIGVFFVFSVLFWGAYEQAGSSLNLFADRYTRLSAFGARLESSWFQALPAVFVIVLAPVFAALWVRLGPREPSSAGKFAIGLLCVSLSFFLLVPAASLAQSHGVRVSPAWLVGVYLLQVMGELCLSPVGLSVTTKLAPRAIAGSMMGVWFLSLALGNKLGGYVAGFFNAVPLPRLFGIVCVTTAAATLVLFLLIRPIKRLMGGVR